MILKGRPDLIVITGDIVQLGTELEIQSAKNWLLELLVTCRL